MRRAGKEKIMPPGSPTRLAPSVGAAALRQRAWRMASLKTVCHTTAAAASRGCKKGGLVRPSNRAGAPGGPRVPATLRRRAGGEPRAWP